MSDQQFWHALRQTVEQAKAMQTQQYADADRELEAVDDAALPEPQIEAMVRRALGAEATLGPAATASPAILARERTRRLPARRFLAAAAALFLTPHFLAAATVVSAVAATAFVLRYSTKTLPFQSAVYRLVNEHETVATRDAAQGAIYGQLLDGIDVLRAVAEATPPMAQQARGAIRRLHAMLVRAEPFVLREVSGDPTAIGDRVLDANVPLEVRGQALARLTDLMAYGVSALKQIERMSVPANIRTHNEVVLGQLAAMLRDD